MDRPHSQGRPHARGAAGSRRPRASTAGSGSWRHELDGTWLAELSGRTDPFGYVAVYADADPWQQSTGRPGWAIAVEHQLRALESDIRSHGPRAELVAFRACREEIRPRLDELLDARLQGRGRALFVPVSEPDRVEKVALQLELPTRVVYAPHPHVRPLLGALEDGRPAGVVLVTRAGIRVIDVAFGFGRELLSVELGELEEDWREMQGPAGGNPQLSQQTAPQHDRYRRRIADARTHALGSHAGELSGIAAERGWEQVVLAGDPRLTAALAPALAAPGRELVALDRVVAGEPAEVAEVFAADLAAARRRCQAALVERLLSAVHGRPARAVIGLAETLAALADARVEHLVLDLEASYPGAVTEDGRLLPEGAAAAGTSPSDLTDGMIRVALAAGARVTPVEDAAGRLMTPDGVAAFTHW